MVWHTDNCSLENLPCVVTHAHAFLRIYAARAVPTFGV